MSDYSRDSITITLPGWDDTEGAEDSIYISSGGSDTITLSGLTDSNTIIGGASVTGISVPWTTGDANVGTWGNWSNQASTKIRLDGPEADIEINGASLVSMLKAIQERVNILTVNTKLESEWEELKALGEQYRALEKHILDKQATWDKLKAMPPPEID
jgi:hypothetical protein